MTHYNWFQRLLIRLAGSSALATAMACNAAEETAETAPTPDDQSETQPKPTPSPPRVPLRSAEEARLVQAEALIEQLRSDDPLTEAMWLDAAGKRYLGLYKPGHDGRPYAHLIILHDRGHHPDWPGVVRQMRRDLYRHNWNTLSLEVPAPTAAADVDSAEDPLKPLLDAAINQVLARQRIPVVIAAVGYSGSRVAAFASQWEKSFIRGLVFLDPVADSDLEGAIPTLSRMQLEIPVLDLVPEFGARENPERRTQFAHANYQQRIIRGSQPEFAGQESQAARAINRWGNKYVLKRRHAVP